VPMYRGGKVKILGIGSAERSPAVPEVPTMAEALPGFRSVTWFAIVAPPGTPAPLADRINRDVVLGLRRPAVAERLERLALEPMTGTPADAAKFLPRKAGGDRRRQYQGGLGSGHVHVIGPRKSSLRGHFAVHQTDL
jgi:tripartite-type tricarboxylate transporter receptor subunit TctC